MNYSNSQRAGVILYLTALLFGGYGDHAWNRVKLEDTWYYIDCTWDDPTGGGMENYEYYLSTALWTDHEVEREYDPGEESFGYWREYYLTEEQW